MYITDIDMLHSLTGRSSFVYEQVSDKADPTHRIKRQFSKKGTVIVTTKYVM